MGDNGQEQGAEQRPKLSPAYRPPEEDSVVQVRFAGNTAQIIDFNTRHIDAFQLLALASFLEMKGKQTIVNIEAETMRQAQLEAERNRIAIAGRIPDGAMLDQMPPGMRPK